MEIIKNIKELISKRGYKQKAVAEAIGLNERQFSDMLNGRMRIPPETISKLCVFLGTDPNTIFGYKGKGNKSA